ncbi:MAG: hypothetical protein WAS34_18860 [Thiolinea sp.]
MIKIKVTTSETSIEFEYNGSTSQDFTLKVIKEVISQAVEASNKLKK